MKNLTKTAFRNIVFLLFASACLLWQGCKDKEMSQTSFGYTALDSSYKITIETPLKKPSQNAQNTDTNDEKEALINPKNLKEKLILEKNGKTQNHIIMLVFIDVACDDCTRYYEHLNRLDAESKAMIIGVLASKITDNELAHFQKKYEIGFPLLNPKSSQENELLSLLVANKFTRIQSDLKSINNFIASKIDSTSPLESAQKGNPKSNADSSNADAESSAQNTTTQNAPAQNLTPTPNTTNSLPKSAKLPTLPYFVLFDKSQIFFQDYEGIIPEEIFSSDIASLAR